MANLQYIKSLSESKRLPLSVLAERVGISEQQIHLIVRKNSTKIETLEKIAKELNVPVSYFFDEEPVTSGKNKREKESELVESLREQIDLLKGNLADVRENLADKERIIKLYESQSRQ